MKVFQLNWTLFDLVISLSGDGMLTYIASLFWHIMPPIIPFHMESLEFMVNHAV